MKCRIPTVRLISCLPYSNKGIDEDFLMVSRGWHDGIHCPTKEEEPGRAPEDRGHTLEFT